MIKTALSFFLLLGVSGASFAQNSVFKPSAAALAYGKISAARARLVSLNGVGASLWRELDAAGVAVVIVPGQAEPCKTSFSSGKRVISCSDSLAGRDQAYAGLRVAEQAAALRLASMPDSAEKNYMTTSLMTRSWIEAGGQIMTERALANQMQKWWKAKSPAAFDCAAACKTPSLADLLAGVQKNRKAVSDDFDRLQKQFQSAHCESTERGLLKPMDLDADMMRQLDKAAAELAPWSAAVQAFVNEERVWLDAWTPT